MEWVGKSAFWDSERRKLRWEFITFRSDGKPATFPTSPLHTKLVVAFNSSARNIHRKGVPLPPYHQCLGRYMQVCGAAGKRLIRTDPCFYYHKYVKSMTTKELFVFKR